MGLYVLRVCTQYRSTEEISGFPSSMVERSGLRRFGLYDRNSSNQEIWYTFCVEYVYRIFDDGCGRNGTIFLIYRGRSPRFMPKYDMSFEETCAWYDGYDLVAGGRYGDVHYSMYSSKSVVEAMLRHKFSTYWNQTETYEALDVYLQKDIAGLKDAIIKLLAGERVEINTGTFLNDMSTFIIKDDVLTLLVHLGYLSYRWNDKTVCISNKEVLQEYENAI